LDIAINAIGKEELYKYEKPKMGINCVQTFWRVTLFTRNDSLLIEPIMEITINPQTGEIMYLRNIKQRIEN
ncbi:MAG: hypothetical protein AAGU75_19010, partial [Bacillota bacterium]